MAKKSIIPDWYPANIHKRKLSLKEWAEELNVRTFFFEQINNPDKDPRNVPKDAVSHAFIDVVIDGNRNNEVKEITPSIFHIPAVEIDDDKQRHYKFALKQFGSGFTLPIMINFDYDKDTLKEHFEVLVNDVHETLKTKELHQFAFKDMFEKEEFVRKFKHSPQSQGRTPYTEKHAADWYKFKVLDWIDLRLWCVLMDVPFYTKKIHEDVFWNGDKNGGHDLNKTTIPLARELLSPKVNKLLRASANKDRKVDFHKYL